MSISNPISLFGMLMSIRLFFNPGAQEECERIVFFQNYKDNDTSKVKYLGGAFMDTDTVSLSGILIDRKSFLPVAGVSILLKDSANIFHATSASSGEFKFQHFSNGATFSLYCNSPEYKCVIVDSIRLRSGISLQLQVKLIRKP